MLGVLGCPNLSGPDGTPVPAGRNARRRCADPSAERQGPRRRKDIRVSNVTSTAAARFCESVESGHSDQDQSAQIAKALEITEDPVRVDSQCKYAVVARPKPRSSRLPTRTMK